MKKCYCLHDERKGDRESERKVQRTTWSPSRGEANVQCGRKWLEVINRQ
jgi:hypothetical protein